MTLSLSAKNELMTIVIVGHVDHGKSTVIGRLLADTGSLPEGKLEAVKDLCRRTAKPFEYAFLLDALKDEQDQGITIDSARTFFNTKKRRYMIFDAPGHIEFLKNMITGAAHAQAALLVIDAHEGIRENSRRHGFLLSMLGIKQVTVLVNKMDLADYAQNRFESIKETYGKFLSELKVKPVSFIPISAFHGDNIANASAKMSWYKGPTVLEQLDQFALPDSTDKLPFRLPVQDIYKFTDSGDTRRIVSGTIESGSVKAGDEITFWPSQKKSVIATVEEFNKPASATASAGQAVGFTLTTQIYIRPGDLMVKASEGSPQVSDRLRAHIFWMGKTPLMKGKTYRLKLATSRVSAQVVDIVNVMDASALSSVKNREEVDAHEVAEVILETDKPIAFDVTGPIEGTSRFVLVDAYEIAGGGIVMEPIKTKSSLLEDYVKRRSFAWVKGTADGKKRAELFGHKPALILFVGKQDTGKIAMARALEEKLLSQGVKAYYLGMSNLLNGLDSDKLKAYEDRDEHLRRMGEVAHMMADAGFVFITTASDLDEYDVDRILKLAEASQSLVVAVGPDETGRAHLEVAVNQDAGKSAREILESLSRSGWKPPVK